MVEHRAGAQISLWAGGTGGKLTPPTGDNLSKIFDPLRVGMSIDLDLLTKIREELLRMEEDCVHSGKSHFNASTRWTIWNYVFGIPSVILSAVAGAAFFKDYNLIAGALSSVVTVLTSLITFLKPAERSTDHKNAGDQYLSLRNDARVFREVQLMRYSDADAAVDAMSSLTTRRNELNQASPQFSKGDFQKARAGIDAGEAIHRVDKE